MALQRFAAGKGEVLLVATVQGLVAEAARVRAAFDETRPDVVALSLSAESLSALMRYQPDPEVDLFEDLPDADFAYSGRLAVYGEVALPPPDLMEAVRLATEHGVPLRGVDLGEEAYVTAFTKEVGAFALLRYGRVQRRLAKRPPKAADARAFALAWDARVRRVGAIARVEARREEAIATNARLLAEEFGRVLLVVDVARQPGVAARLRAPEAGA